MAIIVDSYHKMWSHSSITTYATNKIPYALEELFEKPHFFTIDCMGSRVLT